MSYDSEILADSPLIYYKLDESNTATAPPFATAVPNGAA